LAISYVLDSVKLPSRRRRRCPNSRSGRGNTPIDADDVQTSINADVQIPGVDWAAVPDTIDTTPTHLIPELLRSARNKTKPRAYTPSMSGSKYYYAVTQLQSEGVLDPDMKVGS
jgi:hypothetical protein